VIFLIAGMLAVTSSLQQIYEKVFRQDHRGVRDLGRLLTLDGRGSDFGDENLHCRSF
jgi:hypothetical protein